MSNATQSTTLWERIIQSVILLLTLPIWFTIFTIMFGLIWLICGVVLLLMLLMFLLAPFFVLFGGYDKGE